MFPSSTHSSFFSLHLDYKCFILESKSNFKHYKWITVPLFCPLAAFMLKHWKRNTALIRLVAPCSGFYILNQPLFNFWKLCFSLPGLVFSGLSIHKLGVFSAKYILRCFFATELGPRLVRSQKLWRLQVGPVSLLCVFELLIHLNPISHSGLIWIRFLRRLMLLLPGSRDRVG